MSALHRLRAYLSTSEESLVAFARRAGIDPARLVEAADGRRALVPEDARRVSAACGGAVSSDDLMSEPAAGRVVKDLAARRPLSRDTTGDGVVLPNGFARILRMELVEATGVGEREAALLVSLATDAIRHTALAVAGDSPAAREAALPRVLRLVLTEILEDFEGLGASREELARLASAIARRALRPDRR